MPVEGIGILWSGERWALAINADRSGSKVHIGFETIRPECALLSVPQTGSFHVLNPFGISTNDASKEGVE